MENEIEIDLIQYFGLLFKKWKLVLLFLLIGLLLGFGFYELKVLRAGDPLYESTSVVYVSLDFDQFSQNSNMPSQWNNLVNDVASVAKLPSVRQSAGVGDVSTTVESHFVKISVKAGDAKLSKQKADKLAEETCSFVEANLPGVYACFVDQAQDGTLSKISPTKYVAIGACLGIFVVCVFVFMQMYVSEYKALKSKETTLLEEKR